nr:hypothetical protein 1 - zebra fish [Danio rerio]
ENRRLRGLYVDTLLSNGMIGSKQTVCGGTKCRCIQFSVLKFLCDSYCAISLEGTGTENGLKKASSLLWGPPARAITAPLEVLFCRHVRLLLVSGWSDGTVSLCPALAHSHPEHPPTPQLKPNLR